jgi:hypothetical protein
MSRKNKLISLSAQEIEWVRMEAEKREISFCEMIRRIIDDRYEDKETTSNTSVKNG